jgi:Fur family transcriptional regulator, ferric uptake regulator
MRGKGSRFSARNQAVSVALHEVYHWRGEPLAAFPLLDCLAADRGLSVKAMLHEPAPDAAALHRALDILRESGQRVTGPRRAILGLLTAEHGPFTAEEVHRRLSQGECDLVTVYRTLTALEEIELVRRCDFGDGSYRYEFNTADHHHHHIVCRGCRSVHVLDVCVADALERIARQLGYAQVTHTLEVFGICPKCQQQSSVP